MVVAVASGKGGTGKTFVATNLFATMKNLGEDAVLADCDAEVPNDSIFIKLPRCEEKTVKAFVPHIDADRCIHCGACAGICRYHAIACLPQARYIKVMDELCHGCRACAYACPNGALTAGWKTVGQVSVYGDAKQRVLFEGKTKVGQHSSVPVIREAVGLALEVGSPYLLLDAPPGCSCPFVHTVLRADFVLLVTEDTPFGLSDLKQTVTVLRLMHKPFGVVVNRAGLGSGELKGYLDAERIGILAEIPFSEAVARDYAEGNLVTAGHAEFESIFRSLFEKLKRYESGVCQWQGRYGQIEHRGGFCGDVGTGGGS